MTARSPRPRQEWLLLRAVQLGASLVPPDARTDWQLEWESELVYRFQRRDALTIAASASLGYGIVRDAIGLRVGGVDEWRRVLAADWRLIDAQRLSVCGTILIAAFVVAPLVPLVLVAQALIARLFAGGAPNSLILITLIGSVSMFCGIAMLVLGARAVRVVGAPLAKGRRRPRLLVLASSTVFSGLLAVVGGQRLEALVGSSVNRSGPLTALIVLVLTAILGRLTRRNPC